MPSAWRPASPPPGHLLFVALDDGQVVAQAAGMIHRHVDKPSELYVDEVGVSPAWQRRGIANLLMDALFAAGREAGCAEAWLGTEPDNLPTRALYDGRKEPAELPPALPGISPHKGEIRPSSAPQSIVNVASMILTTPQDEGRRRID